MKKAVLILIICGWPVIALGQVEISFASMGSPLLFAEGVISNRYSQRDFTLSPSGDELFYTVSHPRGFSVIMHRKKLTASGPGRKLLLFQVGIAILNQPTLLMATGFILAPAVLMKINQTAG